MKRKTKRGIMRGIEKLIRECVPRKQCAGCEIDTGLIRALIACAGEWDVMIANESTGETHCISHVKCDDDLGLCIVISGDAWERHD